MSRPFCVNELTDVLLFTLTSQLVLVFYLHRYFSSLIYIKPLQMSFFISQKLAFLPSECLLPRCLKKFSFFFTVWVKNFEGQMCLLYWLRFTKYAALRQILALQMHAHTHIIFSALVLPLFLLEQLHLHLCPRLSSGRSKDCPSPLTWDNAIAWWQRKWGFGNLSASGQSRKLALGKLSSLQILCYISTNLG